MLKEVVKYWKEEDFSKCFNKSIRQLNPEDLPLQSCCEHSGVIDDKSIESRVISKSESKNNFQVIFGVFFCEILSGCSCSDDPSQAKILENSYCELLLLVDKETLRTEISNVF